MSTLDLILERLDGAKNYGKYVASKCPFHNDQRPSFFVYEDSYRCLACGARGSTQNLLRKLSILPDKVKVYDNKPQSRNPFTRWIAQWGLPKTIQLANNNMEGHFSHYLLGRGIPTEYQKELTLGMLDGYITFPIYNRWQELVGAVARVGENNNSTSKYFLPKGQNPKLLYVPSWKKIKESTEVFVTFGIIDAITLYVMGFASASTTTGQSVNPEAFEHIHKKIIFVPDKLEEKSALHIASKLGWRGDEISLPYPLHCKDVNDWYKLDKDALYDYLAR